MKNIYLILISFIFVSNAFAQPADTANFIIKNETERTVCKRSTIEFINKSNYFPYHTYVWDFGDKSKKDTVYTQANIKHTYSKDGQYTVSLTIIDTSNFDTVLAQKRKINIIKIYKPDASDFTSKADDFLTFNYTFKVSEKFKPFDPTVWQYSWDFGDGETANNLDSLSTFHGFPNENKDPGYKVQLKVHLNPNKITLSNNKTEDCFDTATVFIKVKDGFFKNDSSSKNIPLIPNVFTTQVSKVNAAWFAYLTSNLTSSTSRRPWFPRATVQHHRLFNVLPATDPRKS